MLNKKFSLVLFILLVTPIMSCQDDFLERTPTDQISAKLALQSEQNMQLILNGVHRSLYVQLVDLIQGASSNRAGEHYWIPIGDLLSGGIIHSANANNLGWRDEMQWNNHTLDTDTTVEMLWHHRYNTILHANILINGILSGVLPETEGLNTILGQAYTYRAYSYLSLIQHYAKGYLIGNPATDPGVPLLFSSEDPYTSEPRSSVQVIYDQIGADLEAAIAAFQNGEPRPVSTAFDKSQLNIDVANGVKARWALSKGDWQTAADAAIAAREDYPLMDESAYKSGFNTTLLSEVIWGSNVISTETTYYRSYFYLASNTFNGSQIRTNPKIADRRIVDAIPETDYRGDLFLPLAPNTNTSAANGQGGFGNDPNYLVEEDFETVRDSLYADLGITSRFNLHPYMHKKLRNANPGSIDPDDLIHMRSSEMYLIEAEAKAMMNDISGAQAALSTLGGERDSAYNVTAYNTQAALMEHIKFQRRVELWGEGYGYTDMIRWDEGIDHAANGGSGASEILYQNAYKVDRPSQNTEWLFKIPLQEINANPNISASDQN